MNSKTNSMSLKTGTKEETNKTTTAKDLLSRFDYPFSVEFPDDLKYKVLSFHTEFKNIINEYQTLQFDGILESGFSKILGDFCDWLKVSQTNLDDFIKVLNYYISTLTTVINKEILGHQKDVLYYKYFDSLKEQINKLYNDLVISLLKRYSISEIENNSWEKTEQQPGEPAEEQPGEKAKQQSSKEPEQQPSKESEQQPSKESGQQPREEAPKSVLLLKKPMIELLQVGEEDTRKSKQLEKLKNNGRIEPIPGIIGLIVLNITRGLGKLFENNKNPDNNEKNKTEGGNNTGKKK